MILLYMQLQDYAWKFGRTRTINVLHVISCSTVSVSKSVKRNRNNVFRSFMIYLSELYFIDGFSKINSQQTAPY